MTRASVYRDVAVLASSIVVSIVALLFALHAVDQSERKWCDIVTSLNAAYTQQPPSTPTGVEVARRIADLSRSLECPPTTR